MMPALVHLDLRQIAHIIWPELGDSPSRQRVRQNLRCLKGKHQPDAYGSMSALQADLVMSWPSGMSGPIMREHRCQNCGVLCHRSSGRAMT